jgi:hypothetical protein
MVYNLVYSWVSYLQGIREQTIFIVYTNSVQLMYASEKIEKI